MGSEKNQTDRRYLSRTIQLARRGWGRTAPNPMVGCVLVSRGRVVGEGYHRAAGMPHAEAEALASAGTRARGATLYCNLEPCSHHGRTPPCAEAIVAAGVKRVVASMMDPNPEVSGRGFEFLRQAGVAVNVGILDKRARQLNEAFIHHITTGRSFLFMKAAVTLDGKLAAAGGLSKWISCDQSRRLVHRWRLGADAVMVGRGTVLADDPELTPRPPGGGRGWQWKRVTRVVLDERLDIAADCRLLTTIDRGPVIIFTLREAPAKKRKDLERAGAVVIVVPKSKSGPGVSMKCVLKDLGRRNIQQVLFEGGATLFAAALEEKVVNRMALFLAPKLLGGSRSIPLLNGLPGDNLKQAVQLEDLSYRRVGTDLLVEGYPVYPEHSL